MVWPIVKSELLSDDEETRVGREYEPTPTKSWGDWGRKTAERVYSRFVPTVGSSSYSIVERER